MTFPYLADPQSDSRDPDEAPDPGARAKALTLALVASLAVLERSPSPRLLGSARADLRELAELCASTEDAALAVWSVVDVEATLAIRRWARALGYG